VTQERKKQKTGERREGTKKSLEKGEQGKTTSANTKTRLIGRRRARGLGSRGQKARRMKEKGRQLAMIEQKSLRALQG